MNDSIATAYAMLAATTYRINGSRKTSKKSIDSGVKAKQKQARRIKNKQASKSRKQK